MDAHWVPAQLVPMYLESNGKKLNLNLKKKIHLLLLIQPQPASVTRVPAD